MFYQYQHFGISEYFHKERGENFSFSSHIHHSFELIVLLEGSMTVGVCQKEYSLKAGDAVLVFPNQIHSLESEKSKHMLFIFSPDIIGAYYSKLTGLEPESNKIHIPSNLLPQIETLDSTSSLIKLKAALYSVCAMLDENTGYVKKEKTTAALLYRIFDFAEKNFDTDCSLGKLGKELGYSVTYVSRYFKSMTQMSYVAFINRYRISKACYLLQSSNKTILECSLDCGYTSLRSFNRNFKLQLGITPKEIRSSRP